MSTSGSTRAGRLAAALTSLLRAIPDAAAVAVVSYDGLPMATALPDSLGEDRLAAMSAALLALGEQASVGLGRGRLQQATLEGEHGSILLMSAADRAVLVVIAAKEAKIGMLRYEMRRAAEAVGEVLAEPRESTDAPVEHDAARPGHHAPSGGAGSRSRPELGVIEGSRRDVGG